MKALVECFIEWLQQEKSTGKAWRILDTIARETLKRAESKDAEQREFTVLDIAQACEPHVEKNYDAAKAWFMGGKPWSFLSGRKANLEDFFVNAGHQQALELSKWESKGGNKTVWFLKAYEIPSSDSVGQTDTKDYAEKKSDPSNPDIVYQVTQPGEIRLNILGRLIMGKGAFATYSIRGLLWAVWFLASGLCLVAFGYLFFAMIRVNRPLQTSDLVLLLGLAGGGWVFWRSIVRPMIWLLDDRIILAGGTLMRLSEDAAQLDMAKDADHRYIRLVRYSAVCPICAGSIELRYGYGTNFRRIFGCCSEVPAEHVFTFDRITRVGQRYTR